MKSSNETEGGSQAPHPKRPDATRNARQQKRRDKLNETAQAAGWLSWSAYETAVINGAVEIAPLTRPRATNSDAGRRRNV